MGLKECRECGVKVSTEAKTCPHCGVNKPVSSNGILKWAILGISTIVIVALVSGTSEKDKPVTPSNNIPRAAPEPKKLSPAEHLSEAKKALADGYKPDKNPEKTRWGNVDKARQHLAAIPKNDPLSKDAAKQMAEVNRREKEIEKISKRIVDSMMAQN